MNETFRFTRTLRFPHIFQQYKNNFFGTPLFNHNLSFINVTKTLGIISTGIFLGFNAHLLMNNVRYKAKSIYDDSDVYTWGFNQYGQLGLGSENNQPLPINVEGLKQIQFISCGSDQTAAINTDGKVYSFGRGQDARLGHGASGGLNETYPRLVEELSNKKIIYIDAGVGSHMGAITDKGELYTWGKNSNNQLGHKGGDYPNVVKQLIDLNVKCKQVACGRYHTVVLSEDGKCYAWGGLKYGETGTGTRRNTPEPTSISSLMNVKIVQICAGHDFTLFLSDKGEVYSCGAGDQGQTGHGASKDRCHDIPQLVNGLPKISRIAAGEYHSLAMSEDGKVFSWGLNREGQLGHGDTQNRTTPSQIIYFENDKIIDIAAGGGHSACVTFNQKTKKKKLFLFGRGRQGQIGRANNIESVAAYRPLPVECDYFNSLKKEIVQIGLGSNHSAALCV